MSLSDLKRDLLALDPDELCEPDRWTDTARCCPIATIAIRHVGFALDEIVWLEEHSIDELEVTLVEAVAEHYSMSIGAVQGCLAAYDAPSHADIWDYNGLVEPDRAARLQATVASLDREGVCP